MPPKNCARLEEGTIYIDGCEAKGIEAFESSYDEDMARDYVLDNMQYVRKPDTAEITLTCKMNKIIFLKLIGIWDWALKYCPNRRVVHLMQFGKNNKIKIKNFYRAMKIIAREICY